MAEGESEEKSIQRMVYTGDPLGQAPKHSRDLINGANYIEPNEVVNVVGQNEDTGKAIIRAATTSYEVEPDTLQPVPEDQTSKE